MAVRSKVERIMDVAKVLRSKNAGPFEVTLDVVLPDMQTYSRVVESGALNRDSIAAAYHIPPEDVLVFVLFPAGKGLKVTLRRRIPSGAIGDTDIMGAQQHVPLMYMEIPAAPSARRARA